MTTLSARPPSMRRVVARAGWSLPTWTVPVAAAAVVLARLPSLNRAPGPDEAGFLLVGGQWNGPGTSLYGSYWVDRPPLLVTMFRAASMLGGLPALRLLGCAAALLIVLGAARTARFMHGADAARWTALTAAALCVTPLFGGYEVNGELLAAPFVIGGILAAVSAVRADDEGRGARCAALAGAAAVCAVMVKQNFADVAVFGTLMFVVSVVRSDITRHRFLRLTSAALLGALVALAVIASWTVIHGTSLRGVFDAMYPFRVRAGQVIADGGRVHAAGRLGGLVAVAMATMTVPLMVVATVDLVRRPRRPATEWAMFGTLVFATVTVLVGGSFWHHYLVGLIVPVSLVVGAAVANRSLLVRPLVGVAVASALLAWTGSLSLPQGSEGQTVGSSIAAVAQPTDTIVNLYGHADIVHASGLRSPYEHLWSLPTKTLDPSLTELDTVLEGPDAPTWVVTGRSVRSWGLQTGRTAAILDRDYRRVDTVCGKQIYLRVGVDRAGPRTTTTCQGRPLAVHFKELQP